MVHFQRALNLNCSLNLEADPFGEFSVSKLFRVVGMPSNFQLPLQVSIKYSGNLNGVNFITFGKEDTVKLIDTSWVDVVYDLLDAQEADGFLSSQVAVEMLGKNSLDKINATDAEIWLAALTGGKNEPCNEHFKIRGVIPKGQEASANKICEYFEEACTRFNNAGFDYSNVNWPLEIKFTKAPKNKYLTNTRCYLMNVTYYETIVLSNSLRQDILNEFLSNVLITYPDWNEYLDVNAFQLWASFQFGYDWQRQYHVKDLIKDGNIEFDFTAKAFLLEYIAEKYGGDNIIAQICNKKKRFSLAAADLLGSPKENNWLSKFYEYVTTSARYKEFSDNFFIENSHVKTQIDLGFNAKTFTNDYNALSAKWHHLELATDLTENTELNFNTSVPTSGISIIKYNHTSFESREVLQSGYGALTVSGIKQLAANGYNLFAIVTNNEYDPPNKITSITLKIEKTDELNITGCSVFLRYLTADFTKEYPLGTFTTEKDKSLSMGFPKDTT